MLFIGVPVSLRRVALALIVVVAAAAARANEPAGIRWLFAQPGASAIAADPTASGHINGSSPIVMKGAATKIPPTWAAVAYESFASYATMLSSFQDNTLVPGEQAIMYDNEAWSMTPPTEQENPALYEKLAANLVRSAGFLFIAAPALDLVKVIEPGCSPFWQCYLDLGLAASGARYADVFDIQAQSLENDATKYADFVSKAAAQARRANPKVTVLAGISTDPNGQTTSEGAILGAIAATRGVVDGYWFNIPTTGVQCPACTYDPQLAIDVIDYLGTE
jgi:hypothetical protein